MRLPHLAALQLPKHILSPRLSPRLSPEVSFRFFSPNALLLGGDAAALHLGSTACEFLARPTPPPFKGQIKLNDGTVRPSEF